MNSEYELLSARLSEVKLECEILQKQVNNACKVYNDARRMLINQLRRRQHLEYDLKSAFQKYPEPQDIALAIDKFCDVFGTSFPEILQNNNSREPRFAKMRYCLLYGIDKYFDRRLTSTTICEILGKNRTTLVFAYKEVRGGLKHKSAWPEITRDYIDKLRVFLDTHVKGNEWQR